MARQIALLLLAVLCPSSISYAFAQQPPRVASLGACQLSGGGVIADCRVAYRTFGRLNASRDNVVLIPTWLQGRSEDWIPFIGPRGYVDTTRFHVIIVDALGDGHSSSPSTVPEPARRAFHALTIADMVESQYRLLTENLKITGLHAVVGFSMGGMQALEWAVRYPTFLDRAVPIAGAPRIGAFDHLMWTTTLQIIEHGRRSGVPTDSVWAQLARFEALFVQTPTAVNRSSWDSVMIAAATQGKTYRKSWPLEDFAAQLQAIRRHDISLRFGGDMSRAAKAVRARVFIAHSPDDHMVTSGPSVEFAGMIGAQTLLVPSDCGHVSFFCQQDTLGSAVRSFLAADSQAAAARSPAALVQSQFDAYNRHDAEAVAELFAMDAEVRTLGDTTATRGRVALRNGMAEWFKKAPKVQATLLRRMAHGNYVVDHERVTGLPGGKTIEAIGVYEIKDGAIKRVWWTR